MKRSKPTEFTLHKMDKECGPPPKGHCPICDRKNQRMVNGMCSYCYQADYTKKRKEERKQYQF